MSSFVIHGKITTIMVEVHNDQHARGAEGAEIPDGALLLRGMSLTEEGAIHRNEDGSVVVRALGGTHLLSEEGVTCENPDAPEGERIYQKTFHNRRIFLPEEFDAAQTYLSGSDVIRLGATGYSTIKPEQLAAWGLKPGAYEAAVEALITAQARAIAGNFDGTKIKLVDGASAMGVDLALIRAGKALNLDRLGHSCPKFMFYVKDDPDDPTPIYVAANQADYSMAFVKNADILLSVGGRMQALNHDITAAIQLGYMGKAVIPIDLLGAICAHGGPPAWDANGNVQDATAAFARTVYPMTAWGTNGHVNRFEAIREHVCQVAAHLCYQKLSPARAFGASINS